MRIHRIWYWGEYQIPNINEKEERVEAGGVATTKDKGEFALAEKNVEDEKNEEKKIKRKKEKSNAMCTP